MRAISDIEMPPKALKISPHGSGRDGRSRSRDRDLRVEVAELRREVAQLRREVTALWGGPFGLWRVSAGLREAADIIEGARPFMSAEYDRPAYDR